MFAVVLFMASVVVWLGTLPTHLKDQGRRVTVPSNDLPGNAIAALVCVRAAWRYDHLRTQTPALREQYAFWRNVLPDGVDIEQRLIAFTVDDFASLDALVPVQQCSSTRPHGLVTELEQGQPERLLAESQRLQEFCARHAVHVAPGALIRLPSLFCSQVLEGPGELFYLPAFNDLCPLHKYVWHCNWGRLGLRSEALPTSRVTEIMQGRQATAGGRPESITPDLLATLLDHLRNFAATLHSVQDRHQLQALHQDILSVQHLADDVTPVALQASIRDFRGHAHMGVSGVAHNVPYKAAFVVHVLLQCDLLAHDSLLKQSLQGALRLVVPKPLLPMLLQFSESVVPLPSKSQVSRWRFLLDTAYMLVSRSVRQDHSSSSSVRWMMADSSVQGTHDYELLLMCSAKQAELPRALTLIEMMQHFAKGSDDAEELEQQQEALEQEEALLKELRDIFCVHRPPPVTIGSGRGKVPDRFAAVVHAMFLEEGTAERVQLAMSEVVSCTTDMGTEFSLMRVQGAETRDILPWCCAEPLLDSAIPEHEWPELPKNPWLQFTVGLAMPGLMHVLHNEATRMLEGLSKMEETVSSLQHVARLLRNRGTCDRLCERCFGSTLGQQFHSRLRSFTGAVHRARWGTIAHCTRQVLDLESILRWGWSMERYSEGRVVANADEDDPHHVNVGVVNDALTCSTWWASLRVLDELHATLRFAFAWAEGCHCHNVGRPTSRGKRLAASCPVRGRRAAEVATGDLLQELNARLATSSAELMVTLQHVPAEDVSLLLAEFEAARGGLLFNLALKLQPVMEPPLLMFGIAHHNMDKAKASLRVCLAADSLEGPMADLKREPVLAEAHAWVEGDDIDNLPALAALRSRLRFAYSVERQIEGQHAAMHHYIRKARNHSLPYVSLKHRFPELKAKIAEETFFRQLSSSLHQVRNPKLCADMLGLGGHSSLQSTKSNWDPIYAQVVYRADSSTTQTAVQGVEVRQAQQALQAADSAMQPGASLASLLQVEALHHFLLRVRALYDEGWYAVSLPSSGSKAIRLVSELLSPTNTQWGEVDVPRQRECLVGAACTAVPQNGYVVFSIVHKHPFRAHLASKGDMRTSDLGIDVFRQLRRSALATHVDSYWVLDATPLNARASSLQDTLHLLSWSTNREGAVRNSDFGGERTVWRSKLLSGF